MSIERRLILTRQCQARCGYCREYAPHAREALPPEELREALKETSASGGTLILTGGEPTMHPEFPALAGILREFPKTRVVLESNGFAFRSREAAGLLSGLPLEVWLHAPYATREPFDALTAVPGAFAALGSAINALRETEVAMRLSVPVFAGNLETLTGFLDGGSPLPRVPRFRLSMLESARTPESWQTRSMSAARVTEVVSSFLAMAEDQGYDVQFAHNWYLPLCAQGELRREMPPLTGLPSARLAGTLGIRRDGRCEECALREECPGFDLRVTSVRRPLSGEEALVARYQLAAFAARQPKAAAVGGSTGLHLLRTRATGDEKAIVRVNFVCNMTCPFCFVDLDGRTIPAEQVMARLTQLAEEGVRRVSFSGGEPTLYPHLAEVIAEARRLGIPDRELQTNGLMIKTAEDARRLVEAGLTHVLVSLHGSNEEVARANTNVPGGFERTVRALTLLAETNVNCEVNFVVNGLNFHNAEEFVRFYHREFASRFDNVKLLLSVVRPTRYFHSRERATFAPYSRLVPALVAALRACRELGVPIRGLEGGCGIPPCALREHLDFYADADLTGLMSHSSEANTYLDGCSECSWRPQCKGIPRTYLHVFGADEFRALRS